jgi:hypothetical protein
MEPKAMNYLTTKQKNFIKKNSSLEANTHYSSFMFVMESKGLTLSSQQSRCESVSEPSGIPRGVEVQTHPHSHPEIMKF